MLSRSLAPRFGLPSEKIERLGLFVLLAMTLLAAIVLARTTAETLFLARAGAQAIPSYFLLLGLFSAPTAALFARLIDLRPRLYLLREFLLGAALLALGLRFLLVEGRVWATFASLILLVLVEMLLYIQFWVLVADYFTSLEQKRVVPWLSVAMAIGGLIGGALVQKLAAPLGPRNLLFVLPGLYLLAVLLLAELRRSHRPLEAIEAYRETGLRETLRGVGMLVRRFPVVGWLAIAGFMDVFLGGLAGYLVYGIYEENFPSEARLASFLGALNATFSLLEIPLSWLLTRPLIRRLGVGWGGLFFPVTTLASYTGLAAIFRLPMAIATHFNLDPLAKSVAQPIDTLTYNAVPSRFLGRVRTLSGGWIEPSGMAASGIFLMLAQDRLSTGTMVLVGVVLSVVFVGVGYGKSRSYYRSLTSQLREGTLDLSVIEEGMRSMPRDQRQEVIALIGSTDAEARSLGLEWAGRGGSQSLLGAVVEQIPQLAGADVDLATRYLITLRGVGAGGRLEKLLDDPRVRIRQLALEALLARRHGLKSERIRSLLRDDDEILRSLAQMVDRLDAPMEIAVHEPNLVALGRNAALAVARAAGRNGDLRLLSWLEALLAHPMADVRLVALQSLARMMPRGSELAERLARAPLRDQDPQLRAAAVDLLGRAGEECLPLLARQLGDRSLQVRSRAAKVLGQLGEIALPHLRQALESSRPEERAAAIDATGQVRTSRAESLLFSFLQRDYERVERFSRWLDATPPTPTWEPLYVALEDANRRVLDNVLRVLAALGYTQTLDSVRRVLQGADPRLRANAVETLDSLPHRRFVRPLLKVLERLAQDDDDGQLSQSGRLPEPPLEEIAVSEDRWVCLGAIAVLRRLGRPLPTVLSQDTDMLVRRFIHSTQTEEEVMNRLLLLKRVTLFEGMSLDHLLALDAALRPLEYLAGETIFEQGDLGEHFYVIQRGQISIRAELGGEMQELSRLREGDYFGEMALFDESLRSATATAVTASTLLALDRGRFHSLFDQLPHFGIEISRVLSSRLRRIQNRLDHTLDQLRQGQDPSAIDWRVGFDRWERQPLEEDREPG